MFSKKDYLNISIAVFTLLGLLAFSVMRYRAYQQDRQTTTEQVQLNTLHGKVVYLDDALTMSAYCYVMTKDTVWQQRHTALQVEFDSTISRIYMLMHASYDGKKELESGIAGLMTMEAKAMALASEDKFDEAKALLFSEAYKQHQKIYNLGEDKLINSLDEKANSLMALHKREAGKSAIAEGIIAVLLIIGWWYFLRITRGWQNQVNEINKRRAEESLAAAEKLKDANDQLRQLTAHLQEVREKERLAVAYEINQQLVDQLATVRIKLADIQRNAVHTGSGQVMELQEVSSLLYDALNFLRKLVSEFNPIVLKDLGLVEALAWESERATSEAATVAFFSEVEYVKVDIKTATTLLRTFQEKVQSLLEGGATEIISNLYIEDGHLVLSIYNDAGFISDKTQLPIEELAIRERLSSIKASSKIQSLPETGHSFTILVPYEETHLEEEVALEH